MSKGSVRRPTNENQYQSNYDLIFSNKKKSLDRLETYCLECKDGFYKETSVMDDIQGVLHCNVCNHQVSRYIKE